MRHENLNTEQLVEFNLLSPEDQKIVLLDSFIAKNNGSTSEVRFDGWSFEEKIEFFKNKTQ